MNTQVLYTDHIRLVSQLISDEKTQVAHPMQ